MEKINITYKAPLFDKTGLGHASSSIYSMLHKNENINVEVSPFTLQNFSFNKKKYNPSPTNEICFIFSTPYNFEKYIEEGKINIGYTMWETDKPHDDFINSIKGLDAVLVPCKANEKVFKKINKETHILPLPLSNLNLIVNDAPHPKNDIFTFYSIYEWTERKGGLDSIEAFFRQFYNQKNVKLIIKTKGPFITEIANDLNKLKERIKEELNISILPNVEFIIKVSNDAEMRTLHEKNHCYLSLSKGEGWNLPLMDAAVYGNYIVSTHPLGITEYLEDGELFFPIKSKKVKVENMDWFKYMDESHKWMKPSIESAQEQMQKAYDHWHNTKEETRIQDQNKFRKLILEKFYPDTISEQFIEIVNKIVKKS